MKKQLETKDKEINDLKGKITILNEQLSKEINKNKLLENENLNLINQIQQLINKFNSENNNQIISNNSNTYLEMLNLYKQISELNEKLKRYPFALEKGEKMMSVIFSSVDKNIHYSIVCKNTDKINKLEEELYKEYPQFSETDNYFMCKGKVLNKFHTFESNNIKNGDVIVVNQKE